MSGEHVVSVKFGGDGLKEVGKARETQPRRHTLFVVVGLRGRLAREGFAALARAHIFRERKTKQFRLWIAVAGQELAPLLMEPLCQNGIA